MRGLMRVGGENEADDGPWWAQGKTRRMKRRKRTRTRTMTRTRSVCAWISGLAGAAALMPARFE